MLRKLSDAECRRAMAEGEFEERVRGAAEVAAIILTQSWCPQWRYLQGYLEGLDRDLNEPGSAAAILYLEYDREPFFQEFMAFKENSFGNREVPYIRFYHRGKLVAESNFISPQAFSARMKSSR